MKLENKVHSQCNSLSNCFKVKNKYVFYFPIAGTDMTTKQSLCEEEKVPLFTIIEKVNLGTNGGHIAKQIFCVRQTSQKCHWFNMKVIVTLVNIFFQGKQKRFMLFFYCGYRYNNKT